MLIFKINLRYSLKNNGVRVLKFSGKIMGTEFTQVMVRTFKGCCCPETTTMNPSNMECQVYLDSLYLQLGIRWRVSSQCAMMYKTWHL